jgi:hypothetical protein
MEIVNWANSMQISRKGSRIQGHVEAASVGDRSETSRTVGSHARAMNQAGFGLHVDDPRIESAVNPNPHVQQLHLVAE